MSVHSDVTEAFLSRNLAASTPVAVRTAALENAADQLMERRVAFQSAIVSEGTKTPNQAKLEVQRCVRTLRLAAEEARRFSGDLINFDQVRSATDRYGWWRYRPLGVIAAITPGNDPLNLVAHKVAPAVAVGAPIIVKPHPSTPTVAKMLVDCLKSSELPEFMLRVAQYSDQQTAELVSDARVRVVSFTGGQVAARKIEKLAIGKRLITELGGVGAALVDQNIDLERAAISIGQGIVANAGQNCIHTQRVIAHRAVHDLLCARIAGFLRSIDIGHQCRTTASIGPLATTEHANWVQSLVSDAVAGGARLITGGKPNGRFFPPTLLSGVDPAHALLSEEVFAPVAVVEKTDTFERGFALLQSAPDMVNAAVFSDSLKHISMTLDLLNAGAIIVNDSTDFRIDAMPFGGMGRAGQGREGLRFAMASYCDPQVVCLRA